MSGLTDVIVWKREKLQKKSIRIAVREIFKLFHENLSQEPLEELTSSVEIEAQIPPSARGRKHFFNFPQQQKCFVNRRSSQSVSRSSCYKGNVKQHCEKWTSVMITRFEVLFSHVAAKTSGRSGC